MKLFLKTKDFSVSGETFELFKDEELDMLVTRPQPENLSKYYESEDYISHTDAEKSLMDKMYQVVKRKNLKNKIQLIENQSNNPKSLLDIGAGTGDFLLFAKSRGFEVVGVEPNEKARQRSSQKGIALHQEIQNIIDQKFDTITLWHVLEHLPNLDDQIKTIASLLKDDGVLVIAVPNFKSYDASYYGKYWAAYDVPRHLWHFSKTSIAKLFDAHGMEVTAIKPMWFDAFYVSMLSEKYKGNKLYLINAFFVGLWSNVKALSTKEHSSLIYILKKKNQLV
ncbi:class I SAM-dependent methyltransferase [Flagellimonas pelagia]|uniref:Class I SAM-dependent methyltransferase n=1 Tax=Flagellimonas pelagia TaxID=2306998 RepID=A0A3A1NKJ1_9FLAO|nr:class I SAM-dependent methyltransferase [Allomuricauda maritima]RIV44633.1 class I SAM-dependent methyltransferase [Allomuricauda maritima]TXJ94695.1 class I SAM-dependent methyltransferase [Allomuricauda maritima]